MVKILFENVLHRIIKGCHRTLNRCFSVRERNDWNAVFFACIVKIHSADFLSGMFLHQISIDVQLSAVLLQLFTRLFKIGFSLWFEIHDFNRIAFALDQVNFAVNDIIRLNQTDIDFCLLYRAPIPMLTVSIADNLLQCRLQLLRCKIRVFGLREWTVIGIKPFFDVFMRDFRFFMPNRSSMDVFYGFVDQRTKEHCVCSHGHKFQFFVEFILQGTGIINRNVGRKSKCSLDVDIFDGFEIEFCKLEMVAIYRLQFTI